MQRKKDISNEPRKAAVAAHESKKGYRVKWKTFRTIFSGDLAMLSSEELQGTHTHTHPHTHTHKKKLRISEAFVFKIIFNVCDSVGCMSMASLRGLPGDNHFLQKQIMAAGLHNCILTNHQNFRSVFLWTEVKVGKFSHNVQDHV